MRKRERHISIGLSRRKSGFRIALLILISTQRNAGYCLAASLGMALLIVACQHETVASIGSGLPLVLDGSFHRDDSRGAARRRQIEAGSNSRSDAQLNDTQHDVSFRDNPTTVRVDSFPNMKTIAADGSFFERSFPAMGHCAINLYGLPRSFKDLVLPSLKHNVIAFNPECDYFIHFYNVTYEPPGRSGKGGTIAPEDVYLLKGAVLQEYFQRRESTPARADAPHVGFAHDENEDFLRVRSDFLSSLNASTAADGSNPYRIDDEERNGFDSMITVMNIAKMWHSQNRVWDLMEDHAVHHNITYDRVAMLRADVVYLTPLSNISNYSDTRRVVIPGFASWPMNDRMVYGPYEAVKIWATGRFARADHHVNAIIPHRDRGWGLNSERFIAYTIVPTIQRETNVSTVYEDRSICFLRARADGTMWILDCGTREGNQEALERILGRPCQKPFRERKAYKMGKIQISCPV